MIRKFVILQSDGALAGRGGAARVRAFGTDEATLEIAEMSTPEAAARARDKATLALAPVMPMTLIKPTAEGPSAEPAAGTVTWGVRAVGAPQSPFDGSGVVVAVLDTGINPSHQAFAGIELVRKNFTSGPADDTHGHGTHCAGTIFGRDVQGQRIGVARGVSKALIGKVLGPGGGGSDKVAEAIQWALQEGAQVISMSLGIDFPGYVKLLQNEDVPTEVATSMALEGYRANVLLFERLASFLRAQEALGKSALLVAAAGNESRRDLDPDFLISVSPPAVADGFVSVAALGQTAAGLAAASFSNIRAMVAGPGVDVVSAAHTSPTALRSMSGTSMATPHVAGVAALWAQKLLPVRSSKIIEARIIANATTTGLAPGTTEREVGAGLIQAPS